MFDNLPRRNARKLKDMTEFHIRPINKIRPQKSPSGRRRAASAALLLAFLGLGGGGPNKKRGRVGGDAARRLIQFSQLV